jgi:hypothetical protein
MGVGRGVMGVGGGVMGVGGGGGDGGWRGGVGFPHGSAIKVTSKSSRLAVTDLPLLAGLHQVCVAEAMVLGRGVEGVHTKYQPSGSDCKWQCIEHSH